MMKPITSILLACTIAATAFADPPAADLKREMLGDRIEHVTFRSSTLDKTMAFTVVYPAGFDPNKRDWPVMFLLHGLGRHERTLVEDDKCREMLLQQPYVIVMPKGENGWYFDSPFDAKRHYATYLDEVIGLAQQMLPISRERSHRAIGGWSAGGFGSVWACIRNPESFSTLATVIAVVDHPSAQSRFPMPENMFGKDPLKWPAFDPLNRAAELKNLNILLVIGDASSDAAMNMRLSEALTAASIKHETKHFPGGHTFPTVQAGMGPILEFVGRNIMDDAHATTRPTTVPAEQSPK